MAKQPTLDKVIDTVSVLGPVSVDDIARASAAMGNWQTVNAQMLALPSNEKGLRTLRAMLAHELARDGGPRDMIVYRVVTRHEQLSKQVRFDAMKKALPIITSGLRRPATA